MAINAERYTHFLQQGLEVARTTVDTWTRLVRTVAGQVPPLATQLDAEAAVNWYFDVAEKLLEAQRDVAKRVLATGATLAAAAKL
jgi:hypothetical protein